MKTKMLLATTLLFCNVTFAQTMDFNFDKIEKDLTAQIELNNKKLHEEISKKIESNFMSQIEKFNEQAFITIPADLQIERQTELEIYNDIQK